MTGSGDGERAQDEAWRAIVDNFGDRVELDEPAPVAPPVTPTPEPDPSPVDVRAAAYDEAERFVPPPPPPLPRPEPKRAVAWAGLFGAPVLVLVALVFSIDLPSLIDYLLIAWFVGGFGYLVATMSQTPREPWDDGSRI
ncbi:MAG: hypothetical protein ABIR39_15995 [Nocardioides sp.]|uniref:hypothetical protein n=1 Tax=Nocardioides sp. TaxID=35761 RepID=UPI003263C509